MALAKLGRYNEQMVVLDGDTKNSTFSELFKNEHPNRYVECYIAEQNMVRETPTQSGHPVCACLISAVKLCECLSLYLCVSPPAGERGDGLRCAGP